MSVNALYTDLSGYYDLMCADIDYQAQSHCIHRLQQLFGNGGVRHLDMACGTGPHIRHFIDAGYASSGLDINQPMLDLAAIRCPEAQFSQQDMCAFNVAERLDLITCFFVFGSLQRRHRAAESLCGQRACGAEQPGRVLLQRGGPGAD